MQMLLRNHIVQVVSKYTLARRQELSIFAAKLFAILIPEFWNPDPDFATRLPPINNPGGQNLDVEVTRLPEIDNPGGPLDVQVTRLPEIYLDDYGP